MSNPWHDLDAYAALPRLGSLIYSPTGRLAVSVSQPNADGTAFQAAWWEVDPAGTAPARRVTRGLDGESFAAFTADGDLLFGAKRPIPAEGESKPDDDTGALWLLPAAGGEAFPLARRSGGFCGIVPAASSQTVLAITPTHQGVADDEADAAKRKQRREKKVAAILHETYPVRYWDHDLDPVDNRLAVVNPDGTLRALTGDVSRALWQPSLSLSADGATLAAAWAVRRGVAEVAETIVVIDVATGERRTVAADDAGSYERPVVSADGTLIACVHTTDGDPATAPQVNLVLIDGDQVRMIATGWDRWGSPVAFSPDNATLYVTADEDGNAPIFAIDLATEQVRRLTDDGAFSSVQLSADGATLFALRTSYADPGSVVAIDTATGKLRELPSPVSYPNLPGRLERVETTAADGTRVPGYLVLPDGDGPAPLALWIHGGPLGSWNGWSWRWCPWLLASRGWAVLLPDPALSTGYGQHHIQRGWGRWGAEPFTDLMALTDAVVARPDIDETRTVAMGGSFGGYMANWVATQTSRFQGIVTHASLWNLETFGVTTDCGWYWAREMTPEMRAANSPHRGVECIATPMLVIHGDLDYRVPIGEGLSLWAELCSRWSGASEDFPHKFLYFPDENHWVLTPQHARIWYETVISFIDAAIGRAEFVRPELL